MGSINLANMVADGGLNEEKIAKTVRTGIRMLYNVIDYYSMIIYAYDNFLGRLT